MSTVSSNLQVIINLARGFLVGSSLWKPEGNGLKSEGDKEGMSVSVKGRKRKGH